MENSSEKINLKDIIEGTAPRETAVFIVGDKKYWADRISKDSLATHSDCESCGIEFKKNYTYQRLCGSCKTKAEWEKYKKLELVEWNGSDAVCLYGDDKYFFDKDDILEYCEENEIESSQLQLVLCYRTSFDEINVCELQQDNVHDDWEPDAELLELEKQLNDYFRKASTNTWMPGNKRISVSF